MIGTMIERPKKVRVRFYPADGFFIEHPKMPDVWIGPLAEPLFRLNEGPSSGVELSQNCPRAALDH